MHRHARTLGVLLAPFLTAALTLTGTSSAYAADDDNDGATATYVVKLADDPVAAYQGELPRLKRTAPASGRRLDPGTGAVKDYVRHLDRRRDEILDAVPGAEKLYDYDYTFNGFAARLTDGQAAKLATTPGVVSVTRSRVQKPVVPVPVAEPAPAAVPALSDRVPGSDDGTQAPAQAQAPAPAPAGSAPQALKGSATVSTTSPTSSASPASPPDVPRFLGLSGSEGLWSELGGPAHAGEGMIVGVIDAFDPTNPMLAPLPEPRPDADVIAKKWRGTCDEGDDSDPAHKVTCNNKVIGAAWFRAEVPDPQPIDVPSPLDMHSHGTHIGTTIAGDYKTPVSVPGTNVSGTLSGLAPAARLAFYKTCWSGGCGGADNLAAIERAVADGVDVISFSIGGTLTNPSSVEAMLNAAKAGVFVSASAGNGGPDTVGNTAPWITTVAAETHDTGYEATLVLGDGSRVTTPAFSEGVSRAPLVNATDVSRPDVAQAEYCAPGTLDPDRAKGKIVICDRGGTGFDFDGRIDEVRKSGAVAAVLANTPTSYQDIDVNWKFPLVMVGPEDRAKLKKYAATTGATATLTPTASKHVRAPVITDFSSSGPDPFSGGDLLKPDIAAPGNLVAAGTVPGGFAEYQGEFGFMDGTSMAAPHIAGLAALLMQLHPGWSPMEVKSALMTTATTTDNQGKPISRMPDPTTETELVTASPLDYGSGTPRITRAADPGLVYDSTPEDWTAYLCAVDALPAAGDGTDACATVPETDPSDLNYPSISVGDVFGAQTVTRTVTNVAAETATYRATLQTPPGYQARVTPQRLTLRPGESATYQVEFTRTTAPYDDWSNGTLTWSDAHSRHRVTSPVTLRAARFGAPADVTAEGGSTTLAARVGWTGELTATAGLYAAEKTTGTLTGVDESTFGADPHTGDAVAKSRLHVPPDASFTRVAITAADHLAGSDLDLYVFDKDGVLVGPWPGTSSDEHADLPPGDYDVYVLQYALPEGVTSQQFTLRTWKVGQGEPAVRGTVSPATQQVTSGDRTEVTVSWPGAVRDSGPYLGEVVFTDGSETVGRTVLTVTP